MSESIAETDEKAPRSAEEAQEAASPSPEGESPEKGAESAERVGATQEEQDQFPREYVEQLRTEAKQHRQEATEAAKRADWAMTEVRKLATEAACRGVITDPDALAWDDSWEKDGSIDHQAIRKAAEALAKSSPWLSRPRPVPGLGEHSDADQGVSLSALLRG